jgi:hypothetical protein
MREIVLDTETKGSRHRAVRAPDVAMTSKRPRRSQPPPQNHKDRDPLLGMMLSNDLIDALSNRSVRLGPPHAPEIKALQPLYRSLDPLVAVARIALLLA